MRERKREMEKERDMACAVWVAHTKHFFTPKKITKGEDRKKESAILFWSVVSFVSCSFSFARECTSRATPFRGKKGERSLERGRQTGRTEAERRERKETQEG